MHRLSKIIPVALWILGLWALVVPISAAGASLCANDQNGNVRAIADDETCEDLPGHWSPLEIEDADWVGAGTGLLRTVDPDDRVLIGSETGVTDARLTLNAPQGADPLRIRRDGTTVFFIDQDGQTGVRSGQPQAALQVNAIQGEDPLLVRRFGTLEPQLLVSAAGNVGIGVENPIDRLSVHNTGEGRAGFFRTENSTNIAAALSGVTDGNGSALFANILKPESTSATLHAIHQGGGRAAWFEGQIRIDRGNHQIVVRDSDNAFKTWTLTSHQSSGGFGIWEDGQGGQGRLLVAAGGNVGIGTTDPQRTLHIEGNNDGADVLVRDQAFARLRLVATDPTDNVGLTIQARGSDTPNRAEIGTTSNHGMVLFTNGEVRLRIAADGSVCIGAC